MEEVFGSCGHKLRGVTDNQLVIKDYERNGRRAISFVCVCGKCAKWYRRHRMVLKNEKAEDKWFAGNKYEPDGDDW